jgi:tetratricopeptide (TPR) repeat protein
MLLSRVKFSTLAVCELIAIVIFLPLSISLWSSGWRHMKYYQQYEKALLYYNACQPAEVLVALEKAEKNRTTISLYILKGNVLIEQGKFAEAMRVYEELIEFTDDTKIPKLGVAVCKMYLLGDKGSETTTGLYQLEKEVKEIVRDNPEFSDAAALLGNIYLQEALSFRKAGKQDRFLTSLELALKEFNRAETPREENWRPPSRNALCSLYLGKAYTLYEKSMERWNSLVHPALPSPETRAISELLYEAIQCLRKAFALRVPHREIMSNCLILYGHLLGLPWLETSSDSKSNLHRQSLIKEIPDLQQAIDRFKAHARWLREGPEYLEKWQLDGRNYEIIERPMHYGLSISYFYVGEEAKGTELMYPLVQSSPAVVFESILEINAHQATKAYLQRKKNVADANFLNTDISISTWNQYQREIERWKKVNDNKPSLPQLILLNNYLIMVFWQREPAATVGDLAKYVQNFANQVPAAKVIVGCQQDPVNAIQVLRHNLFMIYSGLPTPYKENAGQFASYRLTFSK